jgi:NAD(P)-dependent dehydrogenase (short-subunit alcohol dehydrogenase family)
MSDVDLHTVAVVTGAGRGMGRAIATRLAAAGKALVVSDCDADAAIETAEAILKAGYLAVALPLDITNPIAVDRGIEEILQRHGHIDVLVNNAGVFENIALTELTSERWDRMLGVNLLGAERCQRAVVRSMVSRVPAAVVEAARSEVCYGKIVNVASIAARRGRAFGAHYAASKAALLSLTQSAALALARYGINVNAVCPGAVRTQMWDSMDYRLHGCASREEFEERVRTSIPFKRFGRYEEIAGAVSFLCSSDADYITGQALNVDGGQELN